MSAPRVVRVALLLCDTPSDPVRAKHGDYLEIYRTWLQQALDSYPDGGISKGTTLAIDGYHVVDKREYPPAERLRADASDGYDVVMLTGSKHTAYSDNPFIAPLVDFVRNVATSPSLQHIKLVGVCFGHQIISLAMGGKCVAGQNGWEIGVYGLDLTKEGRYWWCGDVEGQGGDERIYVEQMHKDHVPEVPEGFSLLATTKRYPVHSMIKLYPDSSLAGGNHQRLAHIFTIQGHPEFTPSIVNLMVDVRETGGIFDAATTAEARRRAGGKQGTGGEGFGKVGWAIWRVMLQPRYDPGGQP